MTDLSHAGVETLRTFSIVRRDFGSPSGDRIIGRLSGSDEPAGSLHCLIGLRESWVWFDSFERDSDGLLSISARNSSLNPEDDLMYLLPSEFQPPIAFILLDESKTWDKSVFHNGLAATSRFVGTDGQTWTKLRPIQSESELQECETLEDSGWDHEHCSVCNKHIVPGDTYFFHAWGEGGSFLCAFCHDRFALLHCVRDVIYPGEGERIGEQD